MFKYDFCLLNKNRTFANTVNFIYMARIGYFLAESKSIRAGEDLKKLEEQNCDVIYKDVIKNETTRPEWKSLISSMKRGDELFLISLHNAVRGPRQLCLLLELCRVHRIRLVSLRDQIDSWDDMFKSSTANVLDIIGALPGDTLVMRISGEKYDNNKRGVKGQKSERDKICIKMYQEGYPIDDIQKATNFSSKSSVFRILKKYGIEFTRRINKKNDKLPEENGQNNGADE